MSIAARHNQQIIEWNQTTTAYPRTRTVHALFEEQAAKTPDAIAVDYDGITLDYKQLNQLANQLAHSLRKKGVGPEVMVGLFMERSLEMVVGLLGILKAGGAYVPLDMDYPQSRVAFMLEDARVPVLLTMSNLSEKLTGFVGELVCLDTDWKTIELESTENPKAGAAPNNLIYVMYTSGSTGLPKGTLIEHRSVVRLVKGANYIELGPEEVFLQFAPISFDASTFELWGCLLNGAKLVVFPAGHSSLEALGRVIQDKGITTLWLTSALFSQMVNNRLQSLSGVRQLLAGGEALSLPHVQKMLEHLGERRLINGYGPTENTTFTCCYTMTSASQLEQSVPIGRPISNTRVYILDKQMNPVSVGVPGELYIGGDGLARGYLNQPELTAEKFIADPFDDDPTSRLYKTGDKVCYRSDGAIEFIGRFDNQVKLRGFRIEPGEVEAALRSHPGISEAAVNLYQGAIDEPRLVAHVVIDSNWQQQASRQIPDLRGHLARQLPHYMVPAAFVSMDALPLTPNGKVDRQALPVPDINRAQLSSDYRPPCTRLENTLVSIWQQVLKVEQVGINDNFFELGGDSLTGSVLTNVLQDEFGVKLYVVALFDAPTIAEQVTYLKKHFPEAIAVINEGEHDLGEDQSSAKIDNQPMASPVSPRDIDDFRSMAAGWHRRSNKIKRWQRDGNPRMTFILTTPRSGSSLFRIMLAGHPQLFVPPELELLSFDSMKQRRDRLTEGIDFMREGLVRAVMELKSCDADAAQRIIAGHEAREDSVQAFYCLLQQWIGDRMLVDKSATCSMSPQALTRAEQACADNRYIHLVRHPLGTIRSFEEARLDRVLKFQGPRQYTVRQYAELLWIVSHQNILDFLSGVPRHRQLQIRFEELIKNPQSTMERVCDLLNIDFDPLMLEPYRLQEHRMTDGINAQSVGMTDAKFHQHNGIDAGVADAWKHGFDKYLLSEEAWHLAGLLGYEHLVKESDGAIADSQLAVPQPGANEVDRLSDEEVDRRLQAMLSARRTS